MLAEAIVQVLSDPPLFGAASLQKLLLKPATLSNIAIGFQNDGIRACGGDTLKATGDKDFATGLVLSVQFSFPEAPILKFRLDLLPWRREIPPKECLGKQSADFVGFVAVELCGSVAPKLNPTRRVPNKDRIVGKMKQFRLAL
jgi:hypothetical protein